MWMVLVVGTRRRRVDFINPEYSRESFIGYISTRHKGKVCSKCFIVYLGFTHNCFN